MSEELLQAKYAFYRLPDGRCVIDLWPEIDAMEIEEAFKLIDPDMQLVTSDATFDSGKVRMTFGVPQ